MLRTWNEIGRPSLAKYTLASKFYGTKFEMADSSKRRRLRDKCRAAVTRALLASAEDIFPPV
jgi:hypothetical protein